MALHAERLGRGRPLLLVHGLGGSVRSWDLIAPLLSPDRELVIIDLPGHGLSPVLSGRQTISAFADEISEFIEANDLRGVDLVGSSVGARLVLELSRRAVGGNCVALDPGGFWQGWETTFFRTTITGSIWLVRALQPIMPFLAQHAVTRTILLAQLSAKAWKLPPDAVLTEMRTFAATTVFDEMVRELATGPRQAGTSSAPGRVTIGWGRKDHLLLPRQAERARAAFPQAHLHWFSDCGHFPQWDQPDETARLILNATA